MVVEVEGREIALAAAEYDEDLVVVEELAQQSSVLVVVQAVHVGVVPHLAPSEGGVPMALESDAVYGELREQVAFRGAPFDHHLREILVDEDLPEFRIGLERHLDDLRLAVGIGREVHHLRARRALRQVVLLVAGHRRHVEALDEAVALLAVAVDDVIDGARVVLLEHVEIEHVLAHEHLLCHADHLVLAVFVEDDDVVEVGAVAHELVLLQPSADKSVRAVDVELLVGLRHLRGLDGVEVADLRQSRMVFAVLVLEELEPVGRHFREVCQVAVYLLDLCLQAGHELVGLVFAELQDALHLDLQQFEDVVLGYFAYQGRVVWGETLVDMLTDGVDRGCLFKLLILVDALFDEDFLQRLEVQLFKEFVFADLEFLSYQVLRAVYAMAEHVADGEELGLVVLDHTTVGGYADLAVGKGVEGVDGLV